MAAMVEQEAKALFAVTGRKIGLADRVEPIQEQPPAAAAE
jgi:hypothetical protein